MNRFINTIILTAFLLVTTVACAHDSYMHYSEHSRNSSFSITLYEGRGYYDHGYRSRHHERGYNRYHGSNRDFRRMGHYKTDYHTYHGMPNFFQEQFYDYPYCIVKTAERISGYTYRVTFYRKRHC